MEMQLSMTESQSIEDLAEPLKVSTRYKINSWDSQKKFFDDNYSTKKTEGSPYFEYTRKSLPQSKGVLNNDINHLIQEPVIKGVTN